MRTTIRGGKVSMFIDGVQVSVAHGVDGYLGVVSPAPPVPIAGRVWTCELKIKGTGLRDMLCPASVSRTRTGAWLVKGRGPTRRYSTQTRAVEVARERDRRYAVEHRRIPHTVKAVVDSGATVSGPEGITWRRP